MPRGAAESSSRHVDRVPRNMRRRNACGEVLPGNVGAGRTM